MSEEKRFYAEKIRRAAHLLLFRRRKKPGAKAWELRGKLGRKWQEVLNLLNDLLKDLDLEVKPISEREGGSPEDVRYVVTLREPMTVSEARMCGWRIDNLAGLAISIAYLVSKQGKAPREEVERILAEKFGRWRSMAMVDAFVRAGYLAEDERGLLSIDWRTQAEVDLKELMTKLLEAKIH